MKLEIFVLGRFEVRKGGARFDRWPRKGPLRLLKLLATEPRHSIPADQLALALWPDAPAERLRQRLHHQIYLLRAALEAFEEDAASSCRLIDSKDGVVSLRMEAGVWIDADAFEAQLDFAMPQPDDLESLEHALALYGGPLLPGDDGDTIALCRAHLQQRYVNGMNELARRQQAAGCASLAIGSLQKLLLIDPADESVHCKLMRLYSQSGQAQAVERQFADCKALVARELGTELSEHTRVEYRAAVAALRQADSAEASDLATRLPAPGVKEAAPADRLLPPTPLTTLIGRDWLVESVSDRLRDGCERLFTLVGEGGVGKTAAALHIAYRLRDHFDHGVCFVHLAEVSADGVVDRVRRALGIATASTDHPELVVRRHLQGRKLLLVLDNCEHVARALAAVSLLLAHCHGLKVLATSRSRLNLSPECIVQVPSLPVDRHQSDPALGASAYPAAALLFAQRARAVRPDFVLDDGNADDVIAIARQLEGIPLAIELVAARLLLFDVSSMRRLLHANFDVVSFGGQDRPARHRSIKQSLQWSFELLPALARQVLQRLSQFVAPFELRSALAVCSTLAGDVGAALQSLAEANLVHQAHAGTGRLRLSVIVRRFGMEKLLCSDDRQAAGECYAEHFAGVAISRFLRSQSLTGMRLAVQQLDADHDNFLAALDLALECDAKQFLGPLVAGLGWYWGRYSAGARARHWVEQAAQGSFTASDEQRGHVLLAAASFFNESGDFARCRSLAASALKCKRPAADRSFEARCRVLVGAAAVYQGDHVAAIESLSLACELAAATGDRYVQYLAQNNLGRSHIVRGDLQRAHRAFLGCDAIVDNVDNQERAAAVHNLALVAFYMGDWHGALSHSDEALRLEREGRLRPSRLALVYLRRAWFECCLDRPDKAQRALDEATRVARSADLNTVQHACAAMGGVIALAKGHADQAVVSLRNQLEQDNDWADAWQRFEMRMWLFWAALLSTEYRGECASLLSDLAEPANAWPCMQARVLQASAAYLACSGDRNAALETRNQATASHRCNGTRAFPIEERFALLLMEQVVVDQTKSAKRRALLRDSLKKVHAD